MSLNLEEQLRFYGAYHHNSVNIGIHAIGVPVILSSAFLLATNTGKLIPLPEYLTIPHLEPNLGTITCLVYSSLYILMEPVAGGAYSIILLAVTALGDYLRETYGATANNWAIALFVAGWIAQFIGHGTFEGRAPALLDNLFQAIFLAPLFIWLELLFALGYRPELQSRVEKLVQVDIAKYRAEKTQKKLNGNTNGHVKAT